MIGQIQLNMDIFVICLNCSYNSNFIKNSQNDELTPFYVDEYFSYLYDLITKKCKIDIYKNKLIVFSPKLTSPHIDFDYLRRKTKLIMRNVPYNSIIIHHLLWMEGVCSRPFFKSMYRTHIFNC